MGICVRKCKSNKKFKTLTHSTTEDNLAMNDMVDLTTPSFENINNYNNDVASVIRAAFILFSMAIERPVSANFLHCAGKINVSRQSHRQ